MSSNSTTILLVDDTPSSIGVALAALEGAGYQVVVASNGERALQRAALVLPDLILLDVMMPRLDGYETCRRLKAQEATREIPVIFLTALTDTFDKVKGFGLGAVDYLIKPIAAGELLARVHTHVTLSRLERDLRSANRTLEERVAERTAALAAANAALKLNAERMEALLQLNQMTSATRDEIMAFAFEAAMRLTSSPLGYLAFLNEAETVLTMQLWSREAMTECRVADYPRVYAVEATGLWGEAVRQRRPILTNDYSAADPCKRGVPEGHVRLTRHMNVPVMVGGKIVLVAGVGNKSGEYNEADANQLTLLMEGMWRLLERKGAQEALLRLNLELEQRVGDRTAQLEAANKELEAFAHSVSHDLRAPLRHIDGFVALLQAKSAGRLDEAGQHYMDNISEAATRMGLLIDDLLSFSRMARSEMSRAQVDLGGLVQEVIDEFKPECEGRQIRWQVDPLPQVTGDRAMLRMALVNLVSNALKFTRSRAQAQIEIGCLAGREPQTVVFVRDNGVGFDMDYAGRLFGVFQRLHRADEFEGTGIGLANVRRIIARHGGETWAEGAVDRGATFYFSLP